MADPVARISLVDGGENRGVFKDPASLRDLDFHNTGDIAQVYSTKRLYRYDAAEASADDSDIYIKPDNVAGSGRWVKTNTIQLDADALSTPSAGASIVTYNWFLVAEPQDGTPPATVLTPSGSTADLTIPVEGDWSPGGIFVFLQIIDSNGNESPNNPYSPLVNRDASFIYVIATPEFGFLVPPPGARNWHEEYRNTFLQLDSEFESIIAALATVPTLTLDDKNQNASVAIGDNAVVTGVTIANTPALDSYVRVFINSLAVTVGDASDGQDCYFLDPAYSGDPTNPAGFRAIADIQAGDLFVWNGGNAGYNLDGTDRISFDYLVES